MWRDDNCRTEIVVWLDTQERKPQKKSKTKVVGGMFGTEEKEIERRKSEIESRKRVLYP